MKKIGISATLVNFALIALFAIPVDAQSREGSIRLIDFNDPGDRFNRLETGLASLQSRIDSSSVSMESRSGSYCNDDCPDLKTGLHGAFEMIWIKPHFADDTAFVISDFTTYNSLPFENEYTITPRIWIGYQGDDGLGVRFRYWNYDKNARDRDLLVPLGADTEARVAVNDSQGFNAFIDGDAGEVMLARHGLEIHTADWEVTNQFRLMSSQVTVSGGVRYMSLRNDYMSAAIAPDESISESLLHNQRFEGGGPVFSVKASRALGDSGLSLFVRMRGSIAFGEASQRIVDTAGANVTSFRQIDSNKSIAMGEMGAGLRYSLGSWFLRGSWEGQLWTDAGGPIRNTGDIGFHGFSLALGFNR